MKPLHSLRNFLALTGSSVIAICTASAQSNWLNGTSGTQQWNTAGNWDAGVPNAIGAVANLSRDLANSQTVNLATGVTLGSLTYGDTTTGFFTQSIQGSAITFNNSGFGATLTQVNTNNTGTPGSISNNIVLDDNLTITNNFGNADRNNALVLSGVISGSGGIIFTSTGGIGTVQSTNVNNTYSGGVTFNHANAKFTTYFNAEAFGTGTITFNVAGGEVDTSSNGSAALLLTTSNANVWNSNWDLSGFWNNNGNVTLGNNISVTRNSHLGLGGNISEDANPRSLTLTAAGSSVFNGTNTYTGGTTVSGGSLAFLKTASMPSTGNVSFANGTTLGIGLGGDGWTSTGTGAGTLAGIFQGTNVGVGAGSSTLSYTTAVGLNLIVTGYHSFGVIENLGSGATAFTKSGLGTLTISGDNTYTGATTVQGGGELILDYGSSNTSKFASAAALTLGGGGNTNTGMLGGGRITLRGGSFTEVVSATTLGAGQMTIARDGGTSLLRLNAITRAAGGTISFADGTIADTDTNNFGASGANGVIGGWATLGNDWAVSANTGAANTAITALTSYTAFVNTVGSATTNYLLNGTDALAGGTAVGTLKITDGTGGSLTLGANNLTITSTSATALGGIMYAGGVGGNYTIAGGGVGRLGTSAANQELIFAVQSGTLTVNAIFAGNNTITKTGAGTMVIGSTNTGNGFYYINEGVLRLNNAAATGAQGAFGGLSTLVQNGAALELSGGFSFTDRERLMISGSGVSDGGALRNISGANSWRGLIEIGLGGARINNDDNAGMLTITNGITTISGGNVTFGGSGNITVTNPTTETRFSRHAINGGGGLIKDGAGTLSLTGRSNYTGATSISAGILSLTGSINGGGAISTSGTGVLTQSVAGVISGASTFTQGSSGTSTLAGTNTYTGATNVDAGTLIVNGNISTSVLTTVASGATIGGSGTVGALTIQSGGFIAPGNSPGILNVNGNYTQAGIYNAEIQGLLAGNLTGNHDQINVTGTVNIAGGSLATLFSTFTPVLNDLVFILLNDGTDAITGTYTGLAQGDVVDTYGGFNWIISYNAHSGLNTFTGSPNGNDIALMAVVIPEPSVVLLGAIGGLFLLRRRR